LAKTRIKTLWIVLSAAWGLFALTGQGWGNQSVDANISVRPFAGVPPGVINDLQASPGTGEGQVDLVWTSPGVFPGSIPEAYQLRIQTFSVADVGGSVSQWWNAPTGSIFQGLYAEASGSQVKRTVGIGSPDHAVNLTPEANYYFAVRSADDVGVTRSFWSDISAATAGQATNLTPATPQNFIAIGGNTMVFLSWSDLAPLQKTLNFAHYKLERSTDSVTFVEIATTTSASYTDTELTNCKTYIYRLIAVYNVSPGPAIESPPSIASAITKADMLPPAVVSGLSGQISADNQSFTINWSTVTTNLDGTSITDLAAYRITKSTGLFAGATATFYVTASQNSFIDAVNSQNFYYKIRAVDTSGNESPDSNIINSSIRPDITVICDDGKTRLSIPSEISAELRKENNSTGSDLMITPVRLAAEETGNVLKSYRFDVKRADNNQSVPSFAFSKPMINVTFGFLTGSGVKTLAQGDQKLSIYWDNGNRLISLGGHPNFGEGTISVLSSNPGRYQLRVLSDTIDTILTEGSPYPRTITPNGDGINDRVFFFFEATNAPKEGRIYDLKGAFVANMTPGPVQDSSLVWDGKDGRGNVVSRGIYLYKVSLGEKNVTGTVVVAR